MGDSENAQQPSKKRAALKELSRENPGLDDEQDSSALESSTFKTASEEVLASRRIVRVKRRDPPAPPPAASNPFAGIHLVPFTAPAPAAETNKPLSGPNSTPAEEQQETQDERSDAITEIDGDKKDKSQEINTVGKQETQDDGRSDMTKEIIGGEKEKGKGISSGACGGPENSIDNETKTTTKVGDAASEETEKVKDDNNNSNIDKGTHCVDKDSAGDQTEKEGKESDGKEDTEKNGDSGALSTFQQHSSNKNAFTGLASTGFSASSFSFGLVSQEGSTGSGSGSLTGQSSFSFGLPNNGNSSLFGASSSTSNNMGTTTTFPSNQDVSVETGEENEKAAFTADSVMFEYLEGRWKERGKGELKVNISTSDNRKARLVMRSKGNYRLILNASLYPEMKLANMDKKGITFACVNSISEAKNGLSTIALKFKDPTIVEEFRAVIEEHKETKHAVVEAAHPLKTPENSPRGEDA